MSMDEYPGFDYPHESALRKCQEENAELRTKLAELQRQLDRAEDRALLRGERIRDLEAEVKGLREALGQVGDEIQKTADSNERIGNIQAITREALATPAPKEPNE